MDENGFTLIELLVALVVASLLVIGVAQMVSLVAERYALATAPEATSGDEWSIFDAAISRVLPGDPSSIRCDERALFAPASLPLSIGGGEGQLSILAEQGVFTIAYQGERDNLREVVSTTARDFQLSCEVRADGRYRVIDRVSLRWRDGVEARERSFRPDVTGIDICDYDRISRTCR